MRHLHDRAFVCPAGINHLYDISQLREDIPRKTDSHWAINQPANLGIYAVKQSLCHKWIVDADTRRAGTGCVCHIFAAAVRLRRDGTLDHVQCIIIGHSIGNTAHINMRRRIITLHIPPKFQITLIVYDRIRAMQCRDIADNFPVCITRQHCDRDIFQSRYKRNAGQTRDLCHILAGLMRAGKGCGIEHIEFIHHPVISLVPILPVIDLRPFKGK